MADTKITALAAITTVDPAADVLPIVDISDTSMAASGTTKKITSNQILGSGGTATLASATITGALGAAGLNVTGATIPANGVYLGSANNLSFSAASALGMTLNSTGLGVGVVPSAINAGRGLEVGAVGNGLWCSNSTFNQILQNAYYNSGFKYAASASTAASRLEMGGAFNFYIAAAGTAGNAITFTQAMTLDASGNLLVGTTSNYTGANIFSSKGLGTANIATNKFATVEYGSGASGVFTTITVSFTVNSANSSVIIEALLSGFSGVYLDHVAGKYGTQVGVVIRNNASVGTTVAALAVDGTGLIYTLTITTAVTHPVIKVKATVGGQGQTTTLPVITFA